MHNSVRAGVEQIFASLGVGVMCNHRYLGGFLVSQLVRMSFFDQDKVNQWITDTQSLIKIVDICNHRRVTSMLMGSSCSVLFLIVGCLHRWVFLTYVFCQLFLALR